MLLGSQAQHDHIASRRTSPSCTSSSLPVSFVLLLWIFVDLHPPSLSCTDKQGDHNAGKSSLLHQFTKGQCKQSWVCGYVSDLMIILPVSERPPATVGIDFMAKTIEVGVCALVCAYKQEVTPISPSQIEAERVKVQIWDTAGQERYRSLTQRYFRSAIVVILVYDITSWVCR